MTHTEYTTLFRDLATRHQDIQHSEQQSHFARIVLSSDPMFPMGAQVDEFLNGLSYKLHSPFVLLSAYERDFADDRSDNIMAGLNGRIIVLEDLNKRDFESEEAAYTRTDEIALDIVSEVYNQMSEDPRLGMLDWNQVGSEKMRISGRRNLAGTGYSFTLLQTHVNINRSAKFI